MKANWEIGRHIIEFEQQGHERAEYGTCLLERLSKDFKLRLAEDLAGEMCLICSGFTCLIRNGTSCTCQIKNFYNKK